MIITYNALEAFAKPTVDLVGNVSIVGPPRFCWKKKKTLFSKTRAILLRPSMSIVDPMLLLKDPTCTEKTLQCLDNSSYCINTSKTPYHLTKFRFPVQRNEEMTLVLNLKRE